MIRLLGVALLFAGFAAGGEAIAADSYKTTITIRDHRFDPVELSIPADIRVELSVVNEDATPEEFESHELRVEKIIPGGSTGIVRFGPLKPGSYPFFGEFNEATAQGSVVVE